LKYFLLKPVKTAYTDSLTTRITRLSARQKCTLLCGLLQKNPIEEREEEIYFI